MTKLRKGERPLSARSIVASTLLGMRPPRLSTRILVGSGELFGIAEGTTRVALSRMTSRGELQATEDGYALAGPMLDRQARQDISRRGATRSWRGGWRTEVVVGPARSAGERSSLRNAANGLRLAELREGVWLRPDNLPHVALPQAEAVVDEQCTGFTSRPRADAANLAAELWDIASWAKQARALHRRLEQVGQHLGRERLTVLPDSFVLSASVLRHLQADPLLPPTLLPKDWPGSDLRLAYEEYDAAFKSVWRSWYRSQP